MALKEEVVALVQRKCPASADPAAEVDEVEQTILNYCNLNAIPAALKYTWANMAADLADYYIAKNAEPTGTGEVSVGGRVTSVHEGDTTVQIGASAAEVERSNALAAHKANLDSIVLNYANQLKVFRAPRGYGYGAT